MGEPEKRAESLGDSDQRDKAWIAIVQALKSISEEDRPVVIQSVCVHLRIDWPVRTVRTASVEQGPLNQGANFRPLATPSGPGFVERVSLSPKDFILSKEPRTDVERIACLAYYLTHYRDTLHFKTVDLSELNTEAAQPKFSNASQSVGNAAQSGFLNSTVNGNKQLSALGEQYVLALPDRDAARAATERFRKKRSGRKPKTKRIVRRPKPRK